jgi:transposase-like protein
MRENSIAMWYRRSPLSIDKLREYELPKAYPMQILHPFAGSVQQYTEQLSDPNLYRPSHCPQCRARHPLTAHGFYLRTLIDIAFDGLIRVRRYLCHSCKRTVSLLPEFSPPYLRSSVVVIALFLLARLLQGQSLAAAVKATSTAMPYQRGQFWVRRFRRQAEGLCTALAALVQPVPATDFLRRALQMLEVAGWIAAHRFLFADLRYHLLGWPRCLAPDGRRAALSPPAAPA